MPIYEIKTTELWHHNVTYVVEAESAGVAEEMVKAGIGEAADYVAEELAPYSEDEIVSISSKETEDWVWTDEGFIRR